MIVTLIAGLVASAAVLWALWRPIQAALSRKFAYAYPHVAVRLRWVLALVIVLLVIIQVFVPELLWLVVVAALAMVIVQRWRARSSLGQRHRLPPGSLEWFPAAWTDDRFYLHLAGEHGPVFKTSHFVRPTACVVGLNAGIELLRDNESRLETPRLPFSRFVPGGMLRYMSGDHHRRYRSIFRSVFSPAVIRRFDDVFADHVDAALDSMESVRDTGIRHLPVLERMMLQMWFEMFFAIGPESPQSGRLLGLYRVIDITNPTQASSRQIRRAVKAIREIFVRQSQTPSGQAPASLMAVIREQNPSDIEDPVVIGNLVYILNTTAADMTALLNWILQKACEHPQWLDRVAAERERQNDHSRYPLAERFVMETLRMRQSEFLYRAAIRDIDFRGFRIPKGWLVRICVWESHRDPTVFSNPDFFDPDRFLHRSYTREEYSPFGAAAHACLASYLATRVASTFVDRLAARFRVTSAAAGVPVLASTRHWTPGPDFRIQLDARS